MGKSIRSKIKKYHRSIKRREEGPIERQKRALQAVALGALPAEKAPGPIKVPNQPSSGPKRFTFNVHLSKPPEPKLPATERPKVDGITVGKPNGNPRLYNPKPKPEVTDMATETKDSDKDAKHSKPWRSVLRQRIKKKKRSRKARGWGEVPSVLGVVE